MMNFQRREESLELGGQTVTLRELSAGEFEAVSLIEDGNDQLLEMLYMSLTEKPENAQVIKQWPNTIVNQLSSSVMALNGLTEQGN